jgi:methionyl-tRNA formyltransferase
VVFFGTPDFAVPTLARLLSSSHSVVGVITQPDRPRGRGQKTGDAPIKATAAAAGLTVLQPQTLRDPSFLNALTSLGADVGVVAAYGKILPDAVLATPRLGLINVHASLLPRHRGAAPVHRAIMAGDTETGVTIMQVVKALDAGPMLATVRCSIGPDDTSAAVESTLSHVGADLLLTTLNRLSTGPVEAVPQDDQLATYAPRLTKAEGLVDWSRPAEAVHNQIRGLHPWPHAYTYADGRRLILLRSSLSGLEGESPAPVEPGTITAAAGDDLRVGTGRGVIRILEIQAEGKRPMPPRDFLAGHRLAPGDRLSPAP